MAGPFLDNIYQSTYDEQMSSLFGGRYEEIGEEDVRVCQLGNFWWGTRNTF
jgi:hypothetical protein